MTMQSNEQMKLAGFDLPTLKSYDAEQREQLAVDYLSGRRKLSYSAFKKFCESPNLFLRDRLDRMTKQTAAMLEGSVFHALVLEPDVFHEQYTLDYQGKKPGSSQQQEFVAGFSDSMTDEELITLYSSVYSVKGKKPEDILGLALSLIAEFKGYLKFRGELGKKQVISQPVLDKCLMMAQAIRSNAVAGRLIEQLLEHGKAEEKVEFRYRDIDWVGYMDGYMPGEWILDLKKNTDAKPAKVARQIEFDGWAWQAALYSLATDGWDKPYYLIAADNNFQVSVTNVSREQRTIAMRNINWCMQQFEQCLLDPDLFMQSFDYWQG